MSLFNLLCAGALAGFINGAAGTGGGTVSVFAFSSDMQQNKAQASAVMLMCILSAVSLCFRNYFDTDITVLIAVCIGGLIGGVIGAKLLVKTDAKTLKILFAVATVAAGVRLLI